jgi:brefeldin A-resistance guanine nucleotide exchange factor 1
MQIASIIQNISVLDHKSLASVAAAAIKGLSLCLFQSKSLQEKVVILPEFWSILQRLHYHEEVAPMILDILEKVITSPYSTITTSSYMSAVSLADGFCRAATLAYLKTQEGTAHIGHTQATKEPDLRYVSLLSGSAVYDTHANPLIAE